MSGALPAHTDVVVIGAGVGGAATAYWLARAGASVLVLEREAVPGVHSSGRNAAIGRIVCEDWTDRALAREALAFYRNPPPPFEGPWIARACGSLTLARTGALRRLEQTAQALEREGHAYAWWSVEQACAALPLLRGARFERALWCPEEAVLDIHRIVDGLLGGARRFGAHVAFDRALEAIETERGRVRAVRVRDGKRVRCAWVVDAAGAWANAVAERAGLSPIRLRVTRRHLMVTAPDARVDAHGPIAWDVSDAWYVRPESGGWLLSGCDLADAAACDIGPDPEVVTALLEKLVGALPRLEGARLARTWAGLRVLSADSRFVIGPDPRLEGFLWVAGLGGHGMSAGVAAGRIAARWITHPDAERNALERALAPARPAILPGLAPAAPAAAG